LEEWMKKIGFIDHYLNNFHANLYIQLIREGQFKDQFEVAYAFGEAEHDGVDTRKWCEERGVSMLTSPEEVVEKSDFIIVFSPDNPERHYELSKAALCSGKRIYIDKTFAPDLKTARAMIELARDHGTPMFSTSALRYVPEIADWINGVGKDHPLRAAAIRGPGSFEIYAVHMLEPLVMLLGRGARGISYFGDGRFISFMIRYPDERVGGFSQFAPSCGIGGKWYGHPFEASIMFEEGATSLRFTTDNMFKDLVDSICEFFLGGPPAAPWEDTLEIMALIDAGRRAMASAGMWVEVGS